MEEIIEIILLKCEDRFPKESKLNLSHNLFVCDEDNSSFYHSFLLINPLLNYVC